MNKKILIPIAFFFLILVGGFLFWLLLDKNTIIVNPEEIRSCNIKYDCIPVGCKCTCSGCGGFSYEDIINKKYKDYWYKQHNCSEPKICPEVCCSPVKVDCVDGSCVVLSLACAKDAKQCPDGSIVGRISPDCEFEECPIIDPTANWKIFKNDSFEFKYPEELAIGTHVWPPKVTINQIDSEFTCKEEINLKSTFGYGTRKNMVIGDRNYCVTIGQDGTAGRSYDTYQYVTIKEDKQITLEFVIVKVSCGAMADDVAMNECQEKQDSFDPDTLINRIFSTFKFINQ